MPRPTHTDQAGRWAKELRSELTTAEAIVWSQLKSRGCGARFRRQVPIGRWIVDFACFDPRLVLEIDDKSHDWRNETDRTRYIQWRGFPILRFNNEEVYADRVAVFNTIENWVHHLRASGRPPPG